jgi:nitrate/TMAO reductase-like tetraheme cytochrome c subunit
MPDRIAESDEQELGTRGSWRSKYGRFKVPALSVIGIALLLLVAIAVAGPITLAAPKSCSSCHPVSAAYAQWSTSSHAKVACERCHVERATFGGLGNSVALVGDAVDTVTGNSTKSGVVQDGTCLSCHQKVRDDKPFVRGGLRMSHAGLIDTGYRCVECHSDVAHAAPAARPSGIRMSLCARCHNNVKTSGACNLCHVDSRTPDKARLGDPEWSKTHGRDWKTLHGMGDLSTCTLCHDSKKCQGCHGIPLPHPEIFIKTHGKDSLQPSATCLTCHKQSFCDNCHAMPMPHPKGFLPKHPAYANSTNDPRCLRCHPSDSCSDCHLDHVHPGGAKWLKQ